MGWPMPSFMWCIQWVAAEYELIRVLEKSEALFNQEAKEKEWKEEGTKTWDTEWNKNESDDVDGWIRSAREKKIWELKEKSVSMA